MRGKLKVEDLLFCIENDIELSRAQTLLTKEEGTIRWLQEINPGEVFYDIGANIGCYSLYAAQRNARVYAFEPHVGNAMKLLMNVEANGFRDRVEVICLPLSDHNGLEKFYYHSRAAGSSGSQLARGINAAAVETKYAARLDDLRLPVPDYVKIDVDGQELGVLLGMDIALRKARSVQVEVHPHNREGIAECLIEQGFALSHRHHTLIGKKQLASGIPEEQIVHNAVYERRCA